MEFRCSNQPLADGACDALGLGLFSNHWQEQLKSLAPAVASTATALLQQREFKAKPGELISLTLPGEHPALLLVAGLGEPENFDGFALRTAAAQLSKASLGSGCKHII